MAVLRTLFILLVVVLAFGLGRESQAVIYKYVDENGGILFADDLQKIPAEKRSSAVMVSGTDAAPDRSAAERVEAAPREEAVRREQAAAEVRHPGAFRTRLMISLSGAAAVVALLFITGNIDALRERRNVLVRIRTGLVAGLAVLLVVVHFPDVIALFRGAGGTVSGTLSDIQEKQEERGRKAAAAVKAFNTMLEQAERELEQQQPDRRPDEAGQGR